MAGASAHEHHSAPCRAEARRMNPTAEVEYMYGSLALITEAARRSRNRASIAGPHGGTAAASPLSTIASTWRTRTPAASRFSDG